MSAGPLSGVLRRSRGTAELLGRSVVQTLALPGFAPEILSERCQGGVGRCGHHGSLPYDENAAQPESAVDDVGRASEYCVRITRRDASGIAGGRALASRIVTLFAELVPMSLIRRRQSHGPEATSSAEH